MPFVASPLCPGTAFDQAERFSSRERPPAEMAQDDDYLGRTWSKVRDLGWQYTILSEEMGGAGGELEDLVGIAEGCARMALPLPITAACGVAPMLLRAAGARGVTITEQIAAGDMGLVPAVGEMNRDLDLKALPGDSGSVFDLRGKLTSVAALPGMTHVLIGTRCSDEETRLLLLPLRSERLAISSDRCISGVPTVQLAFSGVRLDSESCLLSGPDCVTAISRAISLGTLLSCIEAVSAMGALIEETVRYLSDRKQFGVPLSSFQVIRHRVVDMVIAYSNARALTEFALQQAQDLHMHVSARDLSFTKMRVATVGRQLVHSAIQLHGGMGLTEELFASRLNKRILMSEFDCGDRVYHLQKLLAA